MMDITETVRRSTWHHRPIGRRVMSDEAPYFSIADPDNVGHRDASRRQALARMAFGA
jgi:hypothetical protein